MAKRPELHFPEPPPIGTTFEVDGQRYRHVGTEPYVTRDGREIVLLRWSTSCPECGAEFETGTLHTFRYPARRCPEHRRRGKRIGSFPPPSTSRAREPSHLKRC